jgi:hypothetical protein
MYTAAENRTLNLLSPSIELRLCTGRHPLHVTKICHVTGNGVVTCTQDIIFLLSIIRRKRKYRCLVMDKCSDGFVRLGRV